MKMLKTFFLVSCFLYSFHFNLLAIDLAQGWNLISPKEVTTTATDFFAARNFSNDTQPFDRVWAWNAETRKWQIFSLVANDTIMSMLDAETLTTVEPTQGYWIKTTQSVTFNYSTSGFSVSTPANMETILLQPVTITPNTKTGISTRDRILLKYDNSYWTANSSYEIGLSASLTTFDDLLLKTFYLIEDSSSSCYRLDSEKHSIYSVDYDSSTKKLLMRNAWGYERDSNSAYLCFTFDTTNHTMTATKRFIFNPTSQSYEEDSSFTSGSISYDTTNSYFVVGGSSANITLYDSGFNFSIPGDFNPSNSAFVSNSRVKWETLNNVKSYAEHNFSGDKLQKDTHSNYQTKITTAGNDNDTATAATTMLNQIKSDLESEGASFEKLWERK